MFVCYRTVAVLNTVFALTVLTVFMLSPWSDEGNWVGQKQYGGKPPRHANANGNSPREGYLDPNNYSFLVAVFVVCLFLDMFCILH